MQQHTRRRTIKRRRRKSLLRLFFLAALALVMIGVGLLIGGVLRQLHDGARPAPPYTIAVDAGHGGGDTGANAAVRECDMTAETANNLFALLEADPNFVPVGTRTNTDTPATPAERVAQANRSHADLLLSIHGNANGNSPDTAGFECYPVTPGRSEHEESMRFAALLVDAMRTSGASIRGDNGIRYAYYDANDQKTIVDSSDSTKRKETTFTILERSKCPAVLAEQCFVTNPQDVDAFGDADGCKLCADCYYRAICAYFNVTPYAADSAAASSAL